MADKDGYTRLLLDYQQLKQRIRAARYYGEIDGIPKREGITATIAPSVRDLQARNLVRSIGEPEKEENDRKIGEIVNERKALQASLDAQMDNLIETILTCAYIQRYGEPDLTKYEYRLKNFLV